MEAALRIALVLTSSSFELRDSPFAVAPEASDSTLVGNGGRREVLIKDRKVELISSGNVEATGIKFVVEVAMVRLSITGSWISKLALHP